MLLWWYRLTCIFSFIMKDGRNSKVVVLAHVSPLEKFYNETTSTLKFAQTTATVRNGVLESLDREKKRLELVSDAILNIFCLYFLCADSILHHVVDQESYYKPTKS